MENYIYLLSFLLTVSIHLVQNCNFTFSLTANGRMTNLGVTFLQNSKDSVRKILDAELPGRDLKTKLWDIYKLKNIEALSLHMRILTVFWTSNWDYIVFVIFLLLLLAFAVRYYHQHIEEENDQKIAAIYSLKEREIYDAKIEFFSNLVDEIQTPLTLIKTPLDSVLQKAKQWPEIYSDLATIEKNTNRLLQLMTQVEDIRKTENEKIKLSFVKVNINDLVQNTYLKYSSVIKAKKIKIQLNLSDQSTIAYVNKEALREALCILLNYSTEHCKESIIIDLESTARDFKITIKSDGDPIPERFKDKILQPFLKNPEEITSYGLGMELSLARTLIHLHKGSLVLDTNDMLCTSFVAVLPLQQEPNFDLDSCEKREDNDYEEGVSDEALTMETTILVVEDNVDLLDFITRNLEENYKVVKARNAFEAFGIIKREPIQLIITDVLIPEINGFELCKKVKTELETSHIPVILLTAKDDIESKTVGLEAGSDASVLKPFSIEYLKAQVSNLIENRRNLMAFYSSSPLSHLKSVGRSPIDDSFITKLDTIIHESLSNTELNVEILAEAMAMSRSTFYRKTKDITNLNPNELINIARLRKATELLNNGNHKVYEIAELVGYSSQTTFRRNFQKQFKMTPQDYILIRDKGV